MTYSVVRLWENSTLIHAAVNAKGMEENLAKAGKMTSAPAFDTAISH